MTLCLPAFGQTPGYIKNYPPNVYKASPTVYTLVMDDSGIMYFGTNKGVIVYDGARWELITLSNYSNVVTLEKGPDGKIYVGANSNFGYLKNTPTRGYQYISISDSLPPDAPAFNDVWQILFIEDDIYFQTYFGIFKLASGKITFDKIKDVHIFNINNQLYASAHPNSAFGRYKNGNIDPINNFPWIDTDMIFQVFEYDETHSLIATGQHGLFLFDMEKNEFPVFKTPANSFFKKNQFYDGIRISPELYGLGSWEAGMIIMDRKGKIIHKLDQQSGLFGNHIYEMKIGFNNDLWLATSNGISRISLDSLGIKSQIDKKSITMPILRRVNFYLGSEKIELSQIKGVNISVDDQYMLRNDIINIYQLPSALSLYFAAPGFAGEETSYSVFLDGYDKNWSDWKSNPMKEYTNLDEGNYTFYIQAKKNITSELSEIISYNINIIAPWYSSIWLKVIVGFFIFTAILLIVRLTIIRLKTQNLRLESIVNERTKELIDQQQKLSEANEKLTLTNKELDSFIYHTSHDLKAPLKSVLGLLNLAKLEDSKRKFTQYHEKMESSIHKLEEFISSIIQYSTSAKSNVQITPIDFNELIDDSLDELQFHEGFEKIKIEKNVHINGIFNSDKKRIQIIINNLLSNSIKYQDRNKLKPKILINIKVENDKVIIAIEDNGIGIKRELQQNVFSMFYRASENSYGSGLGLYIINETIIRLNGNILLESEEGKFSRFIVELPNMN